MNLTILIKSLIRDFKKYRNYKKGVGKPMTFKDVKEYFIGNWRMYLHYNYPHLLSDKIFTIFNLRLQWMNKKCREDGECKICKCDTPALQYCNKSCEGNCYPKMFSDKDFEYFVDKKQFVDPETKTIFHSNGTKTFY